LVARDTSQCSGSRRVAKHNYKEEGIIYPMADGALPEQAAQMAALRSDGPAESD
jgi:hypothetical protein